MKKWWTILFVTLLALGLVACTSNKPEQKNEEITQNASNVFSTKNVTRLDSKNLIDAAVSVSKTIWPATQDDNKPGTVLLVPADNWQYALAATDLIHHPNNGPVLFYEDGDIPEETMKELKRLSPVGNDDGTEVMVIGDADQKIIDLLKDYSIEQITGDDSAEFAKNVDLTYAEVAGDIPQSVIIVSSEEEAKLYSLLAANWIAHMPEPVLYVTKDSIPDATVDALKLRNNRANIYILGPDTAVTSDIENKLQEFGSVTRIQGKDPVETSIAFAKFKDEKTKFGWGLTEPGYGLEFISTENAEFAIAGAPFAHLGKHAPLIWLDKGELSAETHEFLAQLQPTFKDDPTVGPYNHAFILGSSDAISMKTQGMIDQMLEITSASGGGHGGH
ncbi:cell wall-binding repeat-containing protein [Cytobacillus dafuensis]|uniref:Cell wall-binding repeat-containing protein n=1 Tax=Cytobacillus dafuensis TaxID=1742359 RepID=A0A5B8ZCZ6_CYTDA|nr:cell wall-binding repeat-containing protein [Cytobacillus dafuensis]QED49416.1 cell wall-binding repeat-containing protein [Cytobacillus dafuensis]